MRTKKPHKKASKENQEFAFNKSLKYLSFRARSVKEVKDYLARKNFSVGTIDEVIKKLIELKFLNDEAFGRQWIKSRQRNKGKSKFALKLELLNKGLSNDSIEPILKEAEDDFEVAKAMFEKKKIKLTGLSKLEFKKKMVSFLQRRGFSWEIISELFKEN